MSSQDPLDSSIPPERPKDPTHFGGEGLYATQTDTSPAPSDERGSTASAWDFARRNHVPALIAVGGIALLLTALIRRATR